MPKIFVGFFAALLLVLFSNAPQPAAAATIPLGTLTPGVGKLLGFQGNSGTGNNQLLDTYTFNVQTHSTLGAIGLALNFGTLEFTNLTAQLTDGAGTVLATATAASSPFGPAFGLIEAGLTPGTQYLLRVIGSFGQSGTGLYGGALVAISDVSHMPLPPALLLFGTAIAGAAAFARRRAKRNATA